MDHSRSRKFGDKERGWGRWKKQEQKYLVPTNKKKMNVHEKDAMEIADKTGDKDDEQTQSTSKNQGGGAGDLTNGGQQSSYYYRPPWGYKSWEELQAKYPYEDLYSDMLYHKNDAEKKRHTIINLRKDKRDSKDKLIAYESQINVYKKL